MEELKKDYSKWFAKMGGTAIIVGAGDSYLARAVERALKVEELKVKEEVPLIFPEFRDYSGMTAENLERLLIKPEVEYKDNNTPSFCGGKPSIQRKNRSGGNNRKRNKYRKR